MSQYFKNRVVKLNTKKESQRRLRGKANDNNLTFVVPVLAYLFFKDSTQTGDIEVTPRTPNQTVTCHHQSNHPKVEAFPLSASIKGTISKLICLSIHHFLNAEVKQRSCDYKPYKSFGPTWQGIQTQVLQPQDHARTGKLLTKKRCN